jgi:4-hydroxymandelate oxidase
MTTEILGARYDSPIVIAPTGSNRAFHPDGEVAVAKAAKARNHLQILSTVATTSIEEAIAARGAPVWFQLYATRKWGGNAKTERAIDAPSAIVGPFYESRTASRSRGRTPVPCADQDRGPA